MNVRSFDCDNARCWEAAQVNGFDSWNYGCMAKCESRDLWRGEHSVMRVPARLGYSPAICFGGEDRRCRNEQHVSRPKRSGREIADWARSRGCEADGVLAGNRTGTRRSEGRQVIQSPRWCPNFVQCYLNLLSHRQPIMNPNSPSCLPNSTLPCEQTTLTSPGKRGLEHLFRAREQPGPSSHAIQQLLKLLVLASHFQRLNLWVNLHLQIRIGSSRSTLKEKSLKKGFPCFLFLLC